MARNYWENTSSEMWEAEKRINKEHINPMLQRSKKLLRKDIVWECISQEDLDFWLNSLLSHDKTKELLTDGYDMLDVDKQQWLYEFSSKAWFLKNMKSLKKMKIYRDWFASKKQERSYISNKENASKDIRKTEQDQYLKSIVKQFDTRDVALNNVLEIAFSDLLEDVIFAKTIEDPSVKNCKVYTTNEYDDVISHTDYIVSVTTDQWDRYYAYDLTLSANKENLKKKAKYQNVICRDFNSTHWTQHLAIPRFVIQIVNRDFILKYLSRYMELVEKQKWEILPWDALKVLQSLHKRDSVIDGIGEMLVDTLT